jgi:hypothetical protein
MEKDFRDVRSVQTAVKLSVSMAERNICARNVVANLYVNIEKLDQSVRIVVGNLFARIGNKKRSAKNVMGVLTVNTDVRNQDVHWVVVVVLFVCMAYAEINVGKDAVVALSVDMDVTNGDVQRKEITNIVNTMLLNNLLLPPPPLLHHPHHHLPHPFPLLHPPPLLLEQRLEQIKQLAQIKSRESLLLPLPVERRMRMMVMHLDSHLLLLQSLMLLPHLDLLKVGKEIEQRRMRMTNQMKKARVVNRRAI